MKITHRPESFIALVLRKSPHFFAFIAGGILLLGLPCRGFSEVSNQSDYSYQFLQTTSASSGSRGSGGDGFPGEKEDITQAEVAPAMTSEERLKRDNIREMLRLIDGDTVTVGKETQVRLIGVKFPQFDGGQRNRAYEEFADRSKKWIKDFMADPESALDNYEGMNSRVKYTDKAGMGFVFYYLYFPDTVLEDMRKDQLGKYDDLVKKKVSERVETDKDRSDAAKAALKDREHTAPPPVVPLELPESVRQYVISEAKFYYPDGTIRREEIFRDGKLMIRRGYNTQGELTEETFHDPKAHLHKDLQEAP